MAASANNGEREATLPGGFRTTHWSVVLAAGRQGSPEAGDALNKLCRTYWYPLYYYVRRHGRTPEDASDLTQAFFARLLEKQLFALADRERGRFRTFLLTSLSHFLTNEREKSQAVQRGGRCSFVSWDDADAEQRFQAEGADHLTPESAYEKRWARTLLETVLGQLRAEAEAAGRGKLFEELKEYLWGGESQITYTKIASDLGLSTTAVKVAAHRLRQRFREVLRAEIAHTVATESEIDNELGHLLRVVSS